MFYWLHTLLYRITCDNNGYTFYLDLECSRLLRRVYKVTGKQTSTSNRNLMNFFLYVESQKPTRDERSWMIGMAEAGFNINYIAFHFDIHKTIACWIINHFVQTKLAGDRPRSGRQEKKLTPLQELFIQFTSRWVKFLTANPLCITSRDCFWYASVHQNCQNRLQCTWVMFKMLTFCPFEKHFMTALRSIQMTFCSIWYWIRL